METKNNFIKKHNETYNKFDENDQAGNNLKEAAKKVYFYIRYCCQIVIINPYNLTFKANVLSSMH